jgi:CHRD domain
MAQSSTCTAVTPSNNAFNAMLIGSPISGSTTALGDVAFTFNGTQATVNVQSLGLGNNITGITLFQGTPGTTSAVPVQTFTNANGFNNGAFNGTFTLDQNLINQIEANPGNYFFMINTQQFPNGAVAGALMPAHPQLITGQLAGAPGGSSIGNGTFVLSVGAPNGSGSVPLNFDIATFSLGNGFNSLSLTPTGGGAPIVILGSNATADNCRLVGATTISNNLAQQILASPCAFTLSLSTPAFPNGAVVGPLSAANEVFIPVAGSVDGANGTRFRTDVNVFNNSRVGISDQSATASALLQFFPTGGSNTSSSVNAAQRVNMVNIPPRGTTTFKDVSNALFGGMQGIGAIRIVTPGSVFANAHIYDDQIAAGRGTTGQSEPGMFRSQALQEGVLVGLVAQTLAQGPNTPSFRTNVGFFNPSDNATTIAVELHDANGAVMASHLITLAGWAQTQMALVGSNSLFPEANTQFPASTSVTFLSGNPIFAYASIIDNVTGDASFVTPSSDNP